MKVAISSVCWAGDSREEVLRKARSSGFHAIELLTFPPEIWDCHGNLEEMHPHVLREQLDRHGLKLAALHLGAILTSSEHKRRKLTDYAKRAIDFAAAIGCGTIVEGGPNRKSEPFRPFLKSLEELSRYLVGSHVRMGLENHYGSWIQYMEDYEHILDCVQSPDVGITLDTGHFTSAKVDPAEVAGRFAAHIVHVHIKDHIGAQSVALGSGETNNFGVARMLKASGYNGYLSQELELADEADTDRAAAAGLTYMKRLCKV